MHGTLQRVMQRAQISCYVGNRNVLQAGDICTPAAETISTVIDTSAEPGVLQVLKYGKVLRHR